MNEPSMSDNGFKVVKVLPPTSYGNGPEWAMPAEIATAALRAVYELSPELFGLVMTRATTGARITIPVTVGAGRRRSTLNATGAAATT